MIIETFTRIFVDPDTFDRTIDFYTALLSGQVTMRFAYPDAGLELGSKPNQHIENWSMY